MNNYIQAKCFSEMSVIEKTVLLKDFFRRCGIVCSIEDGKLLIGDSFEFFITLKGKNGIKFSVEVWKVGDSLDGFEMEEAVKSAKLKTLKYVGFDDVFCECIALESILDINRALQAAKIIEDGNAYIMKTIKKRVIAVLKDVIKLEDYACNSPSAFSIDTYFSGKIVSAHEILDAVKNTSF